jgi:hypothetical protein
LFFVKVVCNCNFGLNIVLVVIHSLRKYVKASGFLQTTDR